MRWIHRRWVQTLSLLTLEATGYRQVVLTRPGVRTCLTGTRPAWAFEGVFDSQRHRRRNFGPPYRLLLVVLVALGLSSFFPRVALADEPSSAAITTSLRLQIPAIDLDSRIEPVSSRIVAIAGRQYRQWETSTALVGWHDRSAMPGTAGNIVLAAHSDSYTRVFQNLHRTRPGDLVRLVVGTERLPYRVSEVVELQEVGVPMAQRVRNGRWITPTSDERLTLITCSRPGATHRLVVVARPWPRSTGRLTASADLPPWPQIPIGP